MSGLKTYDSQNQCSILIAHRLKLIAPSPHLILQLHIQPYHKVGACHWKIIVFVYKLTSIYITIRKTIGLIQVIKKVIHLKNTIYFPENKFIDSVDCSEILSIICIEQPVFVTCVVEVLRADIFT